MYFDKTELQVGIDYLHNLQLTDEQACLIFVAEESKDIVPDIRAALDLNRNTYAGGIFPGVIAEGELKQHGFVVSIVITLGKPVILDLDALNASDQSIQVISQRIMASEYKPLVMIISSNSLEQLAKQNHLATFIRGALPSRASFIGGSAGSATLERMNLVFDNFGFYDNAALVVGIDEPSTASAAVGWRSANGNKASLVTETSPDGIIIRKINNRPAADWFVNKYREARNETIEKSNIDFTSNLHISFFSLTGGQVVRAVVDVTPDGGLVLGGTIPLGVTIMLVDTKPRFVDAEVKSVMRELNLEANKVTNSFIVQCVTRPPIMEDDLSTQLQIVEKTICDEGSKGLVGFIAFGEFGHVHRATHIDYLNMSMVVAATMSKVPQTESDLVLV